MAPLTYEKRDAWDEHGKHRLSWVLYTEHAAYELWVIEPGSWDDTETVCRFNGIDYVVGGLETHYRSPQDGGLGARTLCMVLGGYCYPDGSTLAADRFFESWIGDEDAIWEMLRKRAGVAS